MLSNTELWWEKLKMLKMSNVEWHWLKLRKDEKGWVKMTDAE